jgi:hypothetical protein
MDDHGHQPESALFKAPVGAAITVVIGLIVAAVSLLVFVFDLLVTPEVGALITSFVICGMGLTAGFMMLRRLAPPREPMSLFGADRLPVQGAMQNEVAAWKDVRPPEVIIKNARRVHSDVEITPVMKNHGSEGIATHNTHDGAGVAAFVTVVGMTVILVGRLAFAWQFLSLSLLAGGAMALVLCCVHNRQQDSNISAYKIPVAGGIIGAAAVAGIGLIMLRFHFLRDFLGMAVGAGSVIALVLSWSHHRDENPSRPLL